MVPVKSHRDEGAAAQGEPTNMTAAGTLTSMATRTAGGRPAGRRPAMKISRAFRRVAAGAMLTGTLAASACTSSGGTARGGMFTAVDELTPITAGAPLNPFNSNGNTFLGYDVEPLAWSTNNPASPNQMLPALAASWSLSAGGGTLTVHLQPGARWSNGQPVTAHDVFVSAAIWFTLDTAQSSDLSAVKVINNNTVIFSRTPGSRYNQFEPGVLQAPNVIIPASTYERLLPQNIWSIIGTSLRGGPSAAAASRQLTSIGKKVAAFSPRADVSAGPYVIERINAGEAVLRRNPYFYAASRVDPATVLLLHYSGNQQIWSYLQAGRLDYAPYAAMPAGVAQRIAAAGNTRISVPSLVAAALAFDQAQYPYGLLAARRALAYLISRPAVQKVAEAVSGRPSNTTTGVSSSTLGDYLSPAQTAALNPYSRDPPRAGQLLTSAGFTRRGGQWMLPNGRPWSVTLNVPAGFSDWIAAASVIKSELTTFGVPVTVRLAPDYATYLADLYQGRYAVAFWEVGTGPAAYGIFSQIYGSYDGYVPAGATVRRYPTGAAAAHNFLNTPATVNVPALGTVRPGPDTYDLASVDLNSPAGLRRQDADMAILIAATNYSLPVIQLWDYTDVQFVNGKRFTDWPLHHPELLLGTSPGVWMASGYIHPK
jgi:peptide/nickel transport system substrate-binding protein